ncbi:hypothetical protein AGMMS50268_07500 [Spirochaetia bacterium]|nr:hypothetical protein AGMMS50267_17170 [Spirochaetia bacterium]GHV90247.1 hypothetical protein AGMMS50268_07500 [Spirochaetia bacterium]
MSEKGKLVFYLKEEIDAKIQILADVHSELIALGDMVEKLLMDPEDMEEGTPNGVKIIITRIKEQVMNVINSSCH